MIFQFDTDGKPFKEIANVEICHGAAFRLDQKMTCTTSDRFLLKEGQWYILRAGKWVRLEGRWVRPNIEVIKEEGLKVYERARDSKENT